MSAICETLKAKFIDSINHYSEDNVKEALYNSLPNGMRQFRQTVLNELDLKDIDVKLPKFDVGKFKADSYYVTDVGDCQEIVDTIIDCAVLTNKYHKRIIDTEKEILDTFTAYIRDNDADYVVKNFIEFSNQTLDRYQERYESNLNLYATMYRLHIESLKELFRYREAERHKIIEELLSSSLIKKSSSTKPKVIKQDDCPLTPNELKAIPPRPPAKLRSPAGSLIDNKKKQQEWDNKYSQYKKWLK
jgi:hypothetical protein